MQLSTTEQPGKLERFPKKDITKGGRLGSLKESCFYQVIESAMQAPRIRVSTGYVVVGSEREREIPSSQHFH